MSPRKTGRISKDVRNMVRDRLNERIDDGQFKQRLSSLIDSNKGIGNLHCDIGEALARWIAHYLYLLTDDVDRNIAWGPELDWGIVFKWGRGQLRDTSVKNLCYFRLQSPQNKAAFEQRVTELIHEDTAGFVEKLRAEATGALLDYFFHLADEVEDRIRQDFERYHIDKMSI